MAVAGGLLGPVLDGFHSHFGVLRYHNPAPFSVQAFGVELCETAAWVPPLFGLAGVIIGTLYVLLDRALKTPPNSRRAGPGRVLSGILLFVLQYWVSGALLGPAGMLGPGLPPWFPGAAEVFLWLWAAVHWRVFDNTLAGLVVAVLTAVGGPMIEVTLLNFPGWDLYAYAYPNFFKIPTWIAPVYFCGAPAVGNLARAALRALAPAEAPKD